MNFLPFLDEGVPAGGAGMSIWVTVGYIAIIGVVFYFLAIRPQKKQQKQLDALVASIEIGDSILTTSGFYGVVIDVMEEIIIVEFGNNKNCRIPMKKSACVEVEKPNKGGEPEKEETKKDKK